ncbi:hypothetical protein [Flavobacterium aestivum]|uniref:hypothetical protein n=1 Tax=Flavobacterium aestivum TaxID=3003257 RepID=UPI002482A36C|nr:hypothetical protein [Flavobacterium aestivum]
MARVLNMKNVYDQVFDEFKFDGIWLETLGAPETTGLWIVYGNEKQGKTTLSLQLADYLSKFKDVLYVSAEEGVRKSFVSACRRAGIQHTNKKLKPIPYLDFEALDKKLSTRKCPKTVFIDNISAYADELTKAKFLAFRAKHKDKLIIFLSHEERKEPEGAIGRFIKKLSDIYIRVVGNAGIVGGRCPGGIIPINEEKAVLYHGTEILKNNIENVTN